MKPKIIISLLLLAGVGAKEKAYGEDPVDKFAREVVAQIYLASPASPASPCPTEGSWETQLLCKVNPAGEIICDPVLTSLSGDILQVSSLSQGQPLLILWLMLGVTWGVMICDMFRVIDSRCRYSENSLSVADGLPELLLGHTGTKAIRQLKNWLKHLPFFNKFSDLVVPLAILVKWTSLALVGAVSASLICDFMNLPTVSIVVKMTHD